MKVHLFILFFVLFIIVVILSVPNMSKFSPSASPLVNPNLNILTMPFSPSAYPLEVTTYEGPQPGQLIVNTYPNASPCPSTTPGQSPTIKCPLYPPPLNCVPSALRPNTVQSSPGPSPSNVPTPTRSPTSSTLPALNAAPTPANAVPACPAGYEHPNAPQYTTPGQVSSGPIQESALQNIMPLYTNQIQTYEPGTNTPQITFGRISAYGSGFQIDYLLFQGGTSYIMRSAIYDMIENDTSKTFTYSLNPNLTNLVDTNRVLPISSIINGNGSFILNYTPPFQLSTSQMQAGCNTNAIANWGDAQESSFDGSDGVVPGVDYSISSGQVITYNNNKYIYLNNDNPTLLDLQESQNVVPPNLLVIGFAACNNLPSPSPTVYSPPTTASITINGNIFNLQPPFLVDELTPAAKSKLLHDGLFSKLPFFYYDQPNDNILILRKGNWTGDTVQIDDINNNLSTVLNILTDGKTNNFYFSIQSIIKGSSPSLPFRNPAGMTDFFVTQENYGTFSSSTSSTSPSLNGITQVTFNYMSTTGGTSTIFRDKTNITPPLPWNADQHTFAKKILQYSCASVDMTTLNTLNDQNISMWLNSNTDNIQLCTNLLHGTSYPDFYQRQQFSQPMNPPFCTSVYTLSIGECELGSYCNVDNDCTSNFCNQDVQININTGGPATTGRCGSLNTLCAASPTYNWGDGTTDTYDANGNTIPGNPLYLYKGMTIAYNGQKYIYNSTIFNDLYDLQNSYSDPSSTGAPFISCNNLPTGSTGSTGGLGQQLNADGSCNTGFSYDMVTNNCQTINVANSDNNR